MADLADIVARALRAHAIAMCTDPDVLGATEVDWNDWIEDANVALAALREAGALLEWRPIDEAPKDGSVFLPYYKSAYGPCLGTMEWRAEPTAADPSAGRFHSHATLTETAKATRFMPILKFPEGV